jgi:hypothetical protein
MKSVVLFMALELAVLGVHLPSAAAGLEFIQADCRIDIGPCVKTEGGVTVAIDVNPKPLKTLRELTFTATVSQEGRPVADASVTIDLSMPGMFMGKNVMRLATRRDGTYEGKGVIIRCPSGKRTWQAMVTVERAGKESVVSYIFEVP